MDLALSVPRSINAPKRALVGKKGKLRGRNFCAFIRLVFKIVFLLLGISE